MSIEELAAQVLDLARQNGIMIATAESCTGGLVSAALTDIPGSSDVFDRGFLTYSYPAKTQMLGVSTDLLARDGAVSEPVALAMAQGALDRSDAALTVAITGVAGPGASEAKPEGLVWLATATSHGAKATKREFGAVGRPNVREKSVLVALQLLLQELGSLSR